MARILVTLLALAVGIQAAPHRVDVANLAVGEEILELRDDYAKHYYEGNGRVRAVISTAPVNAPGGQGNRLGTDGRDSLDFAADAWVYEHVPGTNNGTNIANRVGRWITGGNLRLYRSFIKLDLGSIPSGVTLDACTLNMQLYTWDPGATPVAIHRVTEDWLEVDPGGVTWNNQPAVAPTLVDTLALDGNARYDWEITGLVQDWVDGTYDNYGFRLSMADEVTESSARAYFYSKDNPTFPQRIPYLIVWYQMPGEIIVAGLSRTPTHPVSGEGILVSARAWAVEAEIDSIDLSYSNDRVEWTAVAPDSVNPDDSTHYFSIPAQDAGDSLHYRIYASSDVDGEYTTPVQSVYIPFTYAIAEIQECDTLVSEVTPKLGEYVHTAGIVTGFLEPRKFFIADAAGPWDAIYVYNAQQTVSVGDSVDVIGTVAEFQGLTQVAGVARFDVNGSNRAAETTRVTFDEARLEAYENVLVRLDSVRIVDAGGNFGSNVAYQCATFDYADTMTLYSTAQSAFVGTPIPDGAFTLVCNIGDYNGRQLIPRYPGDITPIADLATVAILAPGAEMEPGETVTPTAVFRNNDAGTTAQNVRVSFHIGGFYQIDRFITEIGPGAEDTVQFNEWTAIPGVHPVRAFVSFPADPDRSNDTVAMTLTVAEVIPEPGQWSEVAPIPAQAGNRRDMPHRGAWLAVGPDAGGTPAIYATKGNKLQNFYRYDVAANNWAELAPVPLDPVRGRPLRQGARGASDGDNSIFAVHGNNTLAFWRYDIARDSWHSLRDVPEGPSRKRVRGGGDMVHVKYREERGGPPVEYIYFLKGDRDEFWRYHIESGTWQQRQSPPPGIRPRWQRDSWLAARVPPPGHGHGQKPVIYAHKARYFDRASGTHDFYRYHVAEDSWETQGLAGMPLNGLHGGRIKRKKAKDGGAGAYDDGMIYAIKGGNTQQFWMYNVDGDSWTEADTMPTFSPTTGKRRRVNAGADLVRYDGGRFFALKGNKTVEFWRYVVPTGLAQAPRPERSGVMAGVVPAGAPFVKLGPNPLTGGFATLRYSLPKAGPAAVTVYDVAGRSVFSTRSPGHLATGSLSLDMRSLSAGVYLVKVEAGDYTASQKLVVQK